MPHVTFAAVLRTAEPMRGADMPLRGLREVVAIHERIRARGLELRRQALTSHPETASEPWGIFENRKLRPKPPFAFIETAVLPTLLSLDHEAICLYVAAARFCHRFTGLSYPALRLLERQLGLIPCHTDSLTGKYHVGLTRKQILRRHKQVESFHARIHRAATSLTSAGLLSPGAHFNSLLQEEYAGYYLLNASGNPRSVKSGFFGKGNEFLRVPASLIDGGFFWLAQGHYRRIERLPTCDEIRVMLLALRDSDDSRWGGIDPYQIWFRSEDGTHATSSWPSELSLTPANCINIVKGLLSSRYLHVTHVITHRKHLHLIRRLPEKGEPTLAEDEQIQPVISVTLMEGVRLC